MTETTALALPSTPSALVFQNGYQVIGTEVQAAAKAEHDQLPAVGKYLAAFQVTDQATLETVNETLKEVKVKSKALEKAKAAILSPILADEKNARDWFRPREQALAALESEGKSKVGAYHLAQQKIQTAALAAAAEQFKAGQVEAGTTALAAVPEAPAATKGVGVRTVEKFRIVNADLVPREACSPDEAKIKALRALGREVPGVEFYQDTQVAVRTK